MADLIKKIKIKKQDGTFTDYIPIGADAVNIETSDGESVELKLNKKPYYYNAVVDMKADTKLKIGDVCQILEDTGTYKIVNDANLVIDDKNIYQLNNGLKAQLLYYIDTSKQYYTLYQPKLSETVEIGAFNLLVFSNGFTILFDCGYTGQENAIQSFMTEKNISHLDVVIVSHFHADHSGCFEYVARNYCDNKTLFFRQMKCDYSRFGDYGNNYAPALQEQTYTNVLTELGYINNSRVPEQNEIIVINNGLVKMRFLNTDTSFLENYYSAQSESSNYNKSNINNVSLICEISTFKKKLLLTGDIETQAQLNNYKYVSKCDILQVPHHNINSNGYYKFFNNVSPEIAYFNRNTLLSQSYVYWSKYQRQCKGYVPTYYTYGESIEIKVSEKGTELKTGTLDETFYIQSNDNQLVQFIPYYNDIEHNYYAYAEWTIKDVIDMLNIADAPIESYIASNNRYTQFNTELVEMTGVSTNWILSKTSRGFIIRRTSIWDGKEFEFNLGFDYSNLSTYETHYRESKLLSNMKSVNTGLNIAPGQTGSIEYRVRLPQTLALSFVINGTTYKGIAKNIEGVSYRYKDTEVIQNSGNTIIRTFYVTVAINEKNVKVGNCYLLSYNVSTGTTTKEEGYVSEVSNTSYI